MAALKKKNSKSALKNKVSYKRNSKSSAAKKSTKKPTSKSVTHNKKRLEKPKAKSRKSLLERMNEDEDNIERSLVHKTRGYFAKHLDNYESKHGIYIEGTLFFINFLAIALFMVETFGFTGRVAIYLTIFESLLISIFVAEYVLRMWVARDKTKHFFNIYSIIDLIVILPVALNFLNLTFLRIFRILRIFRLLRVLRFQRMFKSKNTLFGTLSDTEIIVIRIILTVFTIIFMFAGLIWAVENKINPGGFSTIFHALYFAIVTLSTVGYGDITPLSPLGKVITVIMILSGIALIPWQLGKLLKVLVQAGSKQNIKCQKCGTEEHELNAVHCNMCGTILKHNRGVDADELELA